MKKQVPQPQFLPINLNVVFNFKWNAHNGEKIENLQVRPFSCIKDLLNLVEVRFKAKGDAITGWNMEKLEFKILGPLVKDFEEESKENFGPMTQITLVNDVN